MQTNFVDEITLCTLASGLEESRVRELSDFARQRGTPLVQALVERANIDEVKLLRQISGELGAPFLETECLNIPPAVLSRVSPAIATKHHCIPIAETDNRLRIAISDPLDWKVIDDLSQFLNLSLERVICPRPIIARMIKASYGLGADTVERMLVGKDQKRTLVTAGAENNLSSDEAAANEPTVVNLVNQILTDAIRSSATDIHFEPYEDRYRVRYRIDGMLEEISLPVSVHVLRLAIASRIKIMSGLDITEKRLPQDGRCQVSLVSQPYDLRVSVLPGVYGEAINIRLQTRHMVKLDLESLGFESTEREKVNHLIVRPHGLILVTGPTGSGKTTTLYTCLSRINLPPTKIITIEDPVEYRMENILQMQVHDTIGFTFARALRSMLRHDPDVMLVGEIRDRETADIAIRSSLTGHLVFATLHTNDAASAFTRLLDIGIEPFLVSSSVLGVVAQRLLRKICPHCKKEVGPSTIADGAHELLDGTDSKDPRVFWEGSRCDQCRFTGYRGRTAIAEVLTVSSDVRRLIQQRESTERIKEQACREGMRTLRQAAILSAREGRTTLSEAVRVTEEEF